MEMMGPYRDVVRPEGEFGMVLTEKASLGLDCYRSGNTTREETRNGTRTAL